AGHAHVPLILEAGVAPILRATERTRRHLARHRLLRLGRQLFLLAAMARHPALAPGFARFLTGPLVRRAFLMRGLAALARNLALLHSIHRRKSTIFFCHDHPPTWTGLDSYPGRLAPRCSIAWAATGMPG